MYELNPYTKDFVFSMSFVLVLLTSGDLKCHPVHLGLMMWIIGTMILCGKALYVRIYNSTQTFAWRGCKNWKGVQKRSGVAVVSAIVSYSLVYLPPSLPHLSFRLGYTQFSLAICTVNIDYSSRDTMLIKASLRGLGRDWTRFWTCITFLMRD